MKFNLGILLSAIFLGAIVINMAGPVGAIFIAMYLIGGFFMGAAAQSSKEKRKEKIRLEMDIMQLGCDIEREQGLAEFYHDLWIRYNNPENKNHSENSSRKAQLLQKQKRLAEEELERLNKSWF